MLKVTRNEVSFIVPEHWISSSGLLKHRAIHALKLFFGDETLEKALKETEKNTEYMWFMGKVRKKKRKEGG